jgi:hypothetical protein
MLLLAQALATDGTRLHGAGKDHSPDWWKVRRRLQPRDSPFLFCYRNISWTR